MPVVNLVNTVWEVAQPMITTLRRRWIILALAVCLLALPGLLNKPTEVRAWSNGVSGPNSYGTHDRPSVPTDHNSKVGV